MPAIVDDLTKRILEFWSKLDKNQRIRLVISAVVLIAAVVGVVTFSLHTNYVELLTVTESKDIKEIEKALTEKNITYLLGENGKIMVDEKQKNQAQFATATLTSLSSSVSFFDSWNQLKMSSTESDKKKLWQDFKKNSLVAQLKMFDNVQDADVDMAIPEKTMYFGGDAQDKPTAYVRIKPKKELTQEQVMGIVSVVASSIEGLSPKDVKVVDNNFNVLTSETGDSDIDRSSSQYKMKLQIKKELENNVKKLYNGISDSFDYINVVANPILDFNKLKTVDSDKRKPSDMDDAIVSSSVSKENLLNGTPGGQPGMDGNPPVDGTPNYPTTSGGDSQYDKTSTTTNRVFRETITETEKALGSINVNESSMSVTLWYGQRVTDENKINQPFIDQFKKDVSLATGIPSERISVNKYKLAPVVEEKAKATEFIKELVDTYGLFALLLLMAIGLIFAMPRGRISKNKQKELDALAAAESESVVKMFEEEVPDIDLDGKTVTLRAIEEFAKKKPDAVAQLLRNWLTDDWT